MITLPQKLMTASALVVLMLGLLHLLYTFRGNKLYPRDTHLERQMRLVAPVISRHTTMWNAWIGFNASHSFGTLLFGLIYSYFSFAQSELLFHSPYLLSVGLVLLLGYAFLAKVYWFKTPLIGILLAIALYVTAIVTHGF